MAITENIRLSIACLYYATSSLLLITSVVMFVGTFALKCEFSKLFGNYFNDYVETPVLILIAGSVLVFADACLGVISLAHKWHNGVIVFVVCTSCLTIVMVVLVVLAQVNSVVTERTMYSQLKSDMKHHGNDVDAINRLQSELKCCGYENSLDWMNETNPSIPQSCCADNPSCETNNSWEIHSTGCYQALNDFFDRRKCIVVVVLAFLGLFEVMAIALSIIVCRQLRREIIREHPAIDNSRVVNTALPRVHNPFGRQSLPSIDNSRTREPYVRRPSLLPPVLNYRSPHESFLRQPPQLRFDRRVALPGSKLNNPAARSRWDN